MKIFFDVDTQNDFMNKDGALYVPDAEKIKSNLARLTMYAAEQCIPVFGSVDRHFGTPEYREREIELQRNGGPFLDHCMDKTFGQRKICQTIVKWSYRFDDDSTTYISNSLIKNATRDEVKEELTELAQKRKDEYLASDEHIDNVYNSMANGIDAWDLRRAVSEIEGMSENWRAEDPSRPPRPSGIYFEKQTYDVFSNPNLEELLKKVKIDEAVLYGVATDYCVKAVVLGLQNHGVQCYVVEDAIKGVDPETTNKALEEMINAGARFVTTNEVLGGKK